MKNLLVGIAIGAAAGCVIRKMAEEGKFRGLHEDLNQLADKAKKKTKNLIDTGANQAEYVSDRIESFAEKAKNNNKM